MVQNFTYYLVSCARVRIILSILVHKVVGIIEEIKNLKYNKASGEGLIKAKLLKSGGKF